MMTFEGLGIDARLIQATDELGHVNPDRNTRTSNTYLFSGSTRFYRLGAKQVPEKQQLLVYHYCTFWMQLCKYILRH
jgi:hypothetical protein